MKIRAVLERTYRLLEDPKNWIKGMSFGDKRGDCVSLSEACRFCLDGAIYKTAENLPLYCETRKFLNSFAAKKFKFTNEGYTMIFVTFNDNFKTTHKDLLAFLKSAINRAKRTGV